MSKAIQPSKLRDLLDKGVIKIEVDRSSFKEDLLAEDILEALKDSVASGDTEPYSKLFDRKRDPYDRTHDKTEPG